MTLVRLDLPRPDQLRDPWAALSAVFAARGWSDSCGVRRTPTAWPRWHYDDGGGNWADLHLVGDGRAVVVGNDHEYSETYFGPAAEYFGEPETDLLAGSPEWWALPLPSAQQEFEWVGFVYGFDGREWSRAAYEPSDGFESVALPALSVESTRERILSLVSDAPGATSSTAAVDALIAAGATADASTVRAVVGPEWDAEAGFRAASAFRLLT